MNPFENFANDIPYFPSAACREIGDPDLWYIDNPSHLRGMLPIIKKICGACVHQTECLQWALDHEETNGIWGGLTPQERRKIKVPAKVRAAQDRRSHAQIKAWELREQGWSLQAIADNLGKSYDAVAVAISREKKVRNR